MLVAPRLFFSTFGSDGWEIHIGFCSDCLEPELEIIFDLGIPNPFLVGKAIKGMVVTIELARIEGGGSSVGMASDWQFEPIGKETN